MVLSLTRPILFIIDKYLSFTHAKFSRALSQVEAVQRATLKDLLTLSEITSFGKKHGLSGALSWEEFDEKLPVTDYQDWGNLIKQQRENGGLVISGDPCTRYQPTSGSTSKEKWIPYTNKFLSEINCAIDQMFADHLRQERRLLRGKQYWSLSWIPTDLREKIDTDANDDMKLLPLWKRILVSQTLAVPSNIALAETSEGSMTAMLTYLAATKDLVFISVWSPTFVLNMLEQLQIKRQEISDILASGKWGTWDRELTFLPCPRSKRAAHILTEWDGKITSDFLNRLWPGMGMVSSWDTSTSAIWARKIKELFPDATFQAKGLWATEGVVTIPFNGKFPLAVTSHFYEFQDLDTEKIHPAWDLKKGQIVKPLLSTGSGMFRYGLSDKLQVTDFLDECPCFTFLGRMDSVDMVGEKMSPEIALGIMEDVSQKFNIQVVSLLGIIDEQNTSQKPCYLMLCEEEKNIDMLKAVAQYTEDLLNESFHYKLARDLNQLGPAQSAFHPEARKLYMKRGEKRGMIMGDVKIEPLILWDETEILDIIRNGN